VQFQRDYDMAFNRNAVSCHYNQENLGMLDNNVAQLLAPTMDAGSRYVGRVETLTYEARIQRLHVVISPARDA
ncbi:MAG: hypothetical protein M3464_20485, partial [Chloroflexota bacterium]|nr:hypothetical protein [Chloroflexota bacterium]